MVVYQFVELLRSQTTEFLTVRFGYFMTAGSVRVLCVFFCFPVLVRFGSIQNVGSIVRIGSVRVRFDSHL